MASRSSVYSGTDAMTGHEGRDIMTAHISPRDVAERRTVAGLLPDRDRAEQAIAALQAAGFTGDQIGLALHDRMAQRRRKPGCSGPWTSPGTSRPNPSSDEPR